MGSGASTGCARNRRILGWPIDVVRSLGFKRLAIFRPGIIAGNAHTPGFLALLGRFVPGSFGTIDQDDIGRAFVGEFLHGQDGTTILENAAMKRRSPPTPACGDFLVDWPVLLLCKLPFAETVEQIIIW